MNNPKISVVLPIYNVEQYLSRCLDSLSRQTYDNLEIVLVDDGSPDNCGIICDEYAKEHNNVLVIHQNNQGISSARNHGVEKSTGEFILFVDPDDYISDDCVSYLVNLINNNSADMSIARSVSFVGDYYTKSDRDCDKVLVLSKIDALKTMLYRRTFGVSACGRLFRKEDIQKHPFPSGKIHEDAQTTYKIINECDTIVYGNKPSYFYFQRNNSITHQTVTEADLNGMTAADEIIDFVSINYPEILPSAFNFAITKAIEYIPRVLSSNDRQTFLTLREYIIRHSYNIINDPNVKLTMKARCLSVKLGFNFSKLFFGLFEFLKMKYIS